MLAYHCVTDAGGRHDPHNLAVTPGRFRHQVESLLARGYELVTVTDFARRLAESGPPAGVCALTFDDGTDDDLLPLLGELGVPGTLFVCPGLLGEAHPWLPGSGLRLMSGAALRDAAALPFVEVGSHTSTHANLAGATAEDAYRELHTSREELEELLGCAVTSVAYPSCHYSPACPAAAERAGYCCAVTCEGRGGWLPFELRREVIASWDGRLTFALKSRGLGHVAQRSALGKLALRARRVLARQGVEAE